ncbi:hypothetical protein ACFQZJ_14240 [Maribacter chungangensis]|uniref:Uncharacterized protein n=1 Tax=Maribacter chungangensis TaxID=1069117 RepID=A0ABW3B766_9FLAO
MKKVCSLIIFLSLLSCDDGDLAIETVDFDSITTVQTCGSVSATASNLLFKINGSEALILELPSGTIKNEVSSEIIKREISSTTKLTYRIFTDDVSKNYFCDPIPPTSPTVSEEVIAEEGNIFITTTSADSETFSHLIELSGISFITANGSRITDLQIDAFGTVTTKL